MVYLTIQSILIPKTLGGGWNPKQTIFRCVTVSVSIGRFFSFDIRCFSSMGLEEAVR